MKNMSLLLKLNLLNRLALCPCDAWLNQNSYANNFFINLLKIKCKVEFNQPFCWLYSVPNLLVFQHLVTLYLGGFVVRVTSEIKC